MIVNTPYVSVILAMECDDGFALQGVPERGHQVEPPESGCRTTIVVFQLQIPTNRPDRLGEGFEPFEQPDVIPEVADVFIVGQVQKTTPFPVVVCDGDVIVGPNVAGVLFNRRNRHGVDVMVAQMETKLFEGEVRVRLI